jgi:hypothetical protein
MATHFAPTGGRIRLVFGAPPRWAASGAARPLSVAGWEDARMSVAKEAVAQRLEGERPGRLRAVIAAIVIGAAVAVIAYRLLRSRPADE